MSHRPAAAVPGTGAHIFSGDAGATVLRTATGRLHNLVQPPDGLLEHLLSADSATDDESTGYLTRLHDEIEAREIRDAEQRWPQARRPVALLGSGALVDGLRDALTDLGATPSSHSSAAAFADRPAELQNALVIAVADDPAERAAWTRLDTLPGRGTAWLRAYRDREVCFVDPISVTTTDPNSSQVRRRRLAAGPSPRHAAAWQAVEPMPQSPIDPVARMLVIARIVTVVLAWAADAPTLADHRRTLWKYVPASGAITEHTVLGFPEPAPSPLQDEE